MDKNIIIANKLGIYLIKNQKFDDLNNKQNFHLITNIKWKNEEFIDIKTLSIFYFSYLTESILDEIISADIIFLNINLLQNLNNKFPIDKVHSLSNLHKMSIDTILIHLNNKINNAINKNNIPK